MIAILAAIAGLVIAPGPVSVSFAALTALAAWRLLGLAVYLNGNELVVRNILRTYRFSVSQVDVRARVVDPRKEFYSAGEPDGYPDLPTATGDNTAQVAKWYELVEGKDRYSLDALMGRAPSDHEHLAIELRQEILSARDMGDDVL